MEEEGTQIDNIKSSPALCPCYFEQQAEEIIEPTKRKKKILNVVSRTEEYLRDRRIPEFIRFLFTKVISQHPNKPIAFLENLLDDCMLFRAGHGMAPVLYEDRHLQAVLKSFDAGNRGWLNACQVRQMYLTLGFTVNECMDDRMPTDLLLDDLTRTQENDLLNLLVAGSSYEESKINDTNNSSEKDKKE